MKKFAHMCTVALLFAGAAAFGQEVTTDATVSSAAGAGYDLIAWLIPLVQGAVALLVSGLVWKLLGKAGVEKNAALDGLLTSGVEKAVGVAEAWANKKADETTGEDKMSKAIETARALLKGTGLDKVAEEKLKAAIEAQVAKLNLDK